METHKGGEGRQRGVRRWHHIDFNGVRERWRGEASSRILLLGLEETAQEQ